jgi:hypothetical protein
MPPDRRPGHRLPSGGQVVQADPHRPPAARALAEALAEWHYDARHVAMARYDAIGFEAAAVTGLTVLTSAKLSRPGPRRVATLRFARPFAVVAAAFDDRRAHNSTVPSAWHGYRSSPPG